MRNFSRRVSILVGLFTVNGACGVIAVGCGGGGTSTSSEDGGGADSTADSSEDVSQGGEAGPDAGSADGLPGSDVASTDGDATLGPDGDGGFVGDSTGSDDSTGTDGDAGVASDAAATDADAGAGMGADADAGPDALDANVDGDAGVTEAASPLTAQTFPSMMAAAYCSNIAACCGTSGDASTFRWQTCFNALLPGGYGGSGTGSNLVDGGHVVFNETEAQTCLSALASADCTTNQVTTAEQQQLYQSCYAAYSGTLEAGAPCLGTIECAPGSFCLPVDGGVGDSGAIGLCQALAGMGGACGFLGTANVGQTVCSYRGSASNGLFCQNISGDAGTTQLPAAEWKCEPQWAVGSECFGNQSCASLICHQVTGGAFLCGSAGNIANASVCNTYAILDAGGGG